MEKEVIIERLFNEWLHSKSLIIEFEKLFSQDNSLIHIREKFLLDFYETIALLFWNFILTNISKLLENSQTNSKDNLSLAVLIDILKKENKNWKEAETKLNNLKIKCSEIKKYRNKNLSHFDLAHSIGENEFNSSTSIEDLYFYYDEVLQIINFTLNEFSMSPKSDIIINHGKHKGANELNRILLEYNDYYVSKLNS